MGFFDDPSNPGGITTKIKQEIDKVVTVVNDAVVDSIKFDPLKDLTTAGDAFYDAYEDVNEAASDFGTSLKDGWYDVYESIGADKVLDSVGGAVVGGVKGLAVGGIPGFVVGTVTGGIGGYDMAMDMTYEEVYDIVTGKEAKDREAIGNKQDEIETLQEAYENRMNEFEDQAASRFMLPEIFQMAIANKASRYSDSAEENIDLMVYEYNNLISQYQNDYSVLYHLQNKAGWAGEILAGLGMIASGFSNDVGTIASGNADWDGWKRVVTIIVQVVVIVMTTQVYLIVALVLSLLVTLDSMYADGTTTSGMLGAIDMIMNDVLHTDSFVKESGYIKKSNEHYQEYIMYFQMSIQLQAMIVGIFTVTPASTTSNTGSTSTAISTYNAIAGSQAAGAASDAYSAYQAYELVDNIAMANASLEQAKKELEAYKEEVDSRARQLLNRKLLASYKETDYILNGPIEMTAMMVADCKARAVGSSDPELTIPIGNIGVRCDDDGEFGYESAFNLNFV